MGVLEWIYGNGRRAKTVFFFALVDKVVMDGPVHAAVGG